MAKDRGDILFANYGVSGPPILQISRKAGELLKENKEAVLKISIIDDMTQKELDSFLDKRFKNMPEKSLDFSLVGFIKQAAHTCHIKRSRNKGFKNAGKGAFRC